MMATLEQRNFWSQCWRRNRWVEGLGDLILPVRNTIWRLRRTGRHAEALRVAAPPQEARPPELSPGIPRLFADGADAPRGLAVGPLFSEVDQQLAGSYRLAGGRCLRVESNALDTLDGLEDIEDRHAYHRLYWAARYARAAALGHTRAWQAFAAELAQWLETDWTRDATVLSSYSVAERIGSLAECLFWTRCCRLEMPAVLIQSITFIKCIKQRVWADAHHLAANVEYGLGRHNHILNNARGLFLASAVLADCPEAAAWRELAFQLWDQLFPKLVLPDGTFAEQSSHYHLLLSRTALEYWLGSLRFSHPLPSGFEDRLRRMFQLANDLVRGDGTVPRFGDISPDRTSSDLHGLLTAAQCYELLDKVRHPAATGLSYYYTGSVQEPGKAEPSKAQAEPLRLYPAGGFAFLRSAASGAELACHGDPRPEVQCHGDSGRGTFEIWWRNRAIIREPGSFHSDSDPAAAYFHGGAAQNVTCLNGLAPGLTAEDSRRLSVWYCPYGGQWTSRGDSTVQFRWEGFRRISPDIIVTRTWNFDDRGSLHLDERIEGHDRIHFESRLCLGDGRWDAIHGESGSGRGEMRCLVDSGAEPGAAGGAGPGSGVRMKLQCFPGVTMQIETCRYLLEYGQTERGSVLVLAGSARLPLSWSASWEFGATA